MANQELVLTGTNAEKASQLISIFKDRQLSHEELSKIMPMNLQFIDSFSQALHAEIQGEKEIAVSAIEAFKQSAKVLGYAMQNHEISENLKGRILDEISKINQNIYDITRKSQENSKESRNFLIGGMCFLAGLVVLVATGGRVPLKA